MVGAALGRKVKIGGGGGGANGGPSFTKQAWYICNQLGGGESGVLSTRPDVLHLRLVPWAGVAALIASSDDSMAAKTLTATASTGSEDTSASFEGRGYCFLPLPAKTGLPVHVNGYFELSSNRRDIWHGEK
jgi:sacsin